MQVFWNKIVTFFSEHWLDAVKLVAFAVLGYIVVRIIIAIFAKIMRKTKIDHVASNFLISMVKLILYTIFLIGIMTLLGIPTNSVIAIFSAFALAISLALQNTFSNFASGIIIVTNKPFLENDYVEINNVTGVIEKITIFSTKLHTFDNKTITIPNSMVVNSNITNYSRMDTRRVDLEFGVAYGVDIDEVKKVIFDVISSNPKILTDPAPFVRLAEHGESSLKIKVRVWVKNPDYWNVFFDMNEDVYKAFCEHNIEIPFNQLDVHMR